MRTKEQIFEFIATELKNNNTIVVATLGNGGGGLTLLQGDNTLPEGIEVTNLDKGRE